MKKSGAKAVSSLREYPLHILGTAWLFVFVLLALTVGFVLPHRAKGQDLTAQNKQTVAQINAADDEHAPLLARASYADVVEKVAPAVVTVRSERKTKAQPMSMPFGDDPLLRQFFGGQMPQMQQQQQPQIERGLGSGVIVQANGTILTNYHVVEGAEQVKVDLPDKRTFDAKVIGTDQASDLAVLKIEAANLPTLQLGNSDEVRVGDVVLAIGNPLGLRQTVTSGIISAKGRQTGISDGSFEDFLQTDAPINHGNSGGALVNVNGELIGINSQILSPSGGSIGIGFAIPSNMAKSVMTQLLNGGKVHRGMLGVGIQDVTADLAQSFGLKDIRGVIVNSVSANSPAEKAGLKRGDVITSLNGVNIRDGNALRNAVAQTAPGTSVSVGYVRGGSEQTAKVTLGEFQPKKAESDSSDSPDAAPAQGKLGLSLQPLTPQISQQLGLTDLSSGVVVMDVQAGSPADEAGIAQGDVIMEVNRQPVKSVEEIKTAVDKANGKSILLLINRKGQTVYLPLKF